MLNWIPKGYLTYAGAVRLALYGVYQIATGDPHGMATLGEAVAISGLRRKLEDMGIGVNIGSLTSAGTRAMQGS